MDASTPAQPDIFISHSSEDDPEVDRIAKALTDAGLTVWVDHQNGIKVGEPSFDLKIQEMLNACKRGLLILTADSAKSLECNGEWRHLLTHKYLYVARLKGFPQKDFPSRLSVIQYANLLRDYGQGMDALIQALQADNAKPLDSNHPGTALALRTSGDFPNNELDLPIVGRDPELTEISSMLTKPKMVVLTGIGGVGKTRLAAELASRAANPDGVIWYHLAKAEDKEAADRDLDKLTSILRTHLDLKDPTMSREDVWANLGRSQTLLILDNAEDCLYTADWAERVNHLDKRSQGMGVLITSRAVWPALSLPRVKPINVLGAAAARQLLLDVVADQWPDENILTPAEADTLAEAAHYHPRLMRIASGWLNAQAPAEVTAALRNLPSLRALADPLIEQALHELIGRTLDLMRRQLGGDTAYQVLQRLVVCRGGFDRAAADVLAPEGVALHTPLDLLVRWNLLQFDRLTKRYSTDPLTRDAVTPDPAAYPLHYAHYYQLAQTLDKAQQYATLAQDIANVEAAFERVLATGALAEAYQLLQRVGETLANLVQRQSSYHHKFVIARRLCDEAILVRAPSKRRLLRSSQ